MPKKKRELYAEQIKKGFVRIKIAQPNVWMQKQKWVWIETHPWLYDTVKDNDVFVFLDMNNRNFNPDNIEKLSRGELVTINRSRGLVKGEPELNKLKIYRLRVKILLLDRAEELGGLVIKSNNYRRLKSDARKCSKKYRDKIKDTLEYKAKCKERYNRIKDTLEYKEYRKQYLKKWRHDKKMKEDEA